MSLLFSLDPFHIILPVLRIPYVLAVQLTRIIRQTAAVSLATNKSVRHKELRLNIRCQEEKQKSFPV